MATFEDFLKLDIRAGEIVWAENLKSQTPAYKLWVDFGKLGIKSSAQITNSTKGGPNRDRFWEWSIFRPAKLQTLCQGLGSRCLFRKGGSLFNRTGCKNGIN